jgi:hypothetical protein
MEDIDWIFSLRQDLNFSPFSNSCLIFAAKSTPFQGLSDPEYSALYIANVDCELAGKDSRDPDRIKIQALVTATVSLLGEQIEADSHPDSAAGGGKEGRREERAPISRELKQQFTNIDPRYLDRTDTLITSKQYKSHYSSRRVGASRSWSCLAGGASQGSPTLPTFTAAPSACVAAAANPSHRMETAERALNRRHRRRNRQQQPGRIGRLWCV